MTGKDHIPLGVGFYPDWFNKHYGISFGKKYYFDPEAKPLITFGMVMLPSIFGCEIIYKDDALPWAMPLNLSEDDIPI